MKTIIFLLTVLSASVYGAEVKISRMKTEPGMQRSFLLKTNLSEEVRLDCQSFIQGIYVGPRAEGNLVMLDAWECEELYGRIRRSLRGLQKHCLDLEDYMRSDYSCF